MEKLERLEFSDTDRSDAWIKATKETLFNTLVTFSSRRTSG